MGRVSSLVLCFEGGGYTRLVSAANRHHDAAFQCLFIACKSLYSCEGRFMYFFAVGRHTGARVISCSNQEPATVKRFSEKSDYR